MESYTIYESENAYNILVRVYNYFDLGIIQKELIDKGYVIFKTATGVFENNDALIEAAKINYEAE